MRRGFQPIMWRIFAPLVLAVPVGVTITSALSPHPPSMPAGNRPNVAHIETVVDRSDASTGSSVGVAVGLSPGTAAGSTGMSARVPSR